MPLIDFFAFCFFAFCIVDDENDFFSVVVQQKRMTDHPTASKIQSLELEIKSLREELAKVKSECEARIRFTERVAEARSDAYDEKIATLKHQLTCFVATL